VILLLALAHPVQAQIVMMPSSLAPGTVAAPYNQAVLANDSDADDTSDRSITTTFSLNTVTAGAIPPGLTLNFFNGVISGTPTTGGTSPFTITATDLNGATGTYAYSITIGTNSLTLTPASLPNGPQATPYNQTVTASGGTGPYTYSVGGRVAGGAFAQSEHRRHHRHPDQQRCFDLHHSSARQRRRYRQAGLYGEHRHQLAHRQSTDAAAGDAGPCL